MKSIKTLIVIVVIIALCVTGWLFGYHNRKSNDNLPTLEMIAEMSEAEVNDLLPGYRISQLEEVWGAPEVKENNEARWEIGEITLIVNYKNNEKVAICGLKDAEGNSVGE